MENTQQTCNDAFVLKQLQQLLFYTLDIAVLNLISSLFTLTAETLVAV